MAEYLQYLMNFGLGAFFAGVMFIVYRQTVKQMREDRKYMEDNLAKLNGRYDDTIREKTTADKESTKISSELLAWLKGKNGHG